MANTVIGASVQVEFSSVGELRKTLQDATQRAKDLKKQFGETSDEFKNAQQDVDKLKTTLDGLNLKRQLKDANLELVTMQEKFGATSKEAIAAAQKVAGLKDQIEDARQAADVFDPGKKFSAFVDVGAKIAAGFSAVQGAMALVGAESEDVEKALLKVQGAMALAQGLSQLKDFGEAWNKVKLFVGNATQGMSAFKRALIGTGIGLFVVAIGTLIAYWDELRDAIKGTNDVTRAYAEAQGEVSKKVSEATQKITEVTTALDLAKKGKISSTEALDIYNKTLGDTFGQATSLVQVEKLIAENTAAYINAIKLRTQAQVFYAKAAEASAKAVTGEDLDPSFFETAANYILESTNLLDAYYDSDFQTEQQKIRTKNANEFKKTSETLTAEADKLMAQALESESKYKTNATKINSKANASRVSSTKTTNNEIAKLEQQRLEALAIAEEARLNLLSEKDRELEILDKKRIEETKKLELGGIKEGSEQRLKFDESYRIKKQEIIDKYDKEEKEREKEFQNTLNAIQEETRLAGITDAREKEKAELTKSYTERLSEIDKNEKFLSDEKIKLKEALLIQQKNAEDALQQKFDQEDLQKKSTNLLTDAANETTAFEQRLKLIQDRKALENQIIFASDEERANFIKENEEATTKVLSDQYGARVQLAKAVGDALGALTDVVGKNTAAGKALAIAQATINTFLGITEVWKSKAVLPEPFNTATKIAATVTTAAGGFAAVRNIAKTKVPGAGGGGGPTPPPPGNLNAPMQPGLSPAVQGQALNAQAINDLGNQSLRAYVMNSDIQNNNQRNAYLQRNARIG